MTVALPLEFDAAASALTWAVLLLASFAPPVLFVLWVRNTELHRREPLAAIGRAFLWGAVVSVIAAVILSFVFLLVVEQIAPIWEVLGRRFSDPQAIVLLVVVAPLAEELAKGFGIFGARRHIREQEDGLVYGAAVGFGFSATENLLYGGVALLQGGLAVSIATIAVRSISASLLHASSSGVFGYGIAKHFLLPGRPSWVPYYFAAVAMHATFNFLAGFAYVYTPLGAAGGLIGFATAVVFALIAISAVRGKIRAIDRAA